MDPRKSYAHALRAAADTLGSDAKLAAFLRVPAESLRAWLAGDEAPPLEAFLHALDVIADGPFAPQERRIRVAVLPTGQRLP